MDNRIELNVLCDLIKTRRSVRRFRAEPVPNPLLEEVLEAARWAPTAGNRQGFRLIVVRSRSLIEKMHQAVIESLDTLSPHLRPDRSEEYQAYFKKFVHFIQAPVVLIPIFHAQGIDLMAVGVGLEQLPTDAVPRHLLDTISSVSAAIMHMLLVAQALGLATCWMTGPLVAATQLGQLLGVTDGWEIAALIPLGYADETPEAPPRRTLSRLVRYLDE